MKGGISILNVGGTGTGKTTVVKNMIKNVNRDRLLIYDINNEYREFYNKPLLDFQDFLQVAKKARNAVIVFEEATIFLSNRSTSDELRDILVRKRHTNNLIILNFHSVRAIPRYVIDLSNTMILGITNDTPKFVEQKLGNELISNSVAKVQKTTKEDYYKEVIQLY